jgi:hypothetical protein
MTEAHRALTSPEAQRCPLCGGWNQCAPASSGSLEGECWCRTARIAPEVLARVPAGLRMKACLCPACAALVDVAQHIDEP